MHCTSCHFTAGDAYDPTEQGRACPRCRGELADFEEFDRRAVVESPGPLRIAREQEENDALWFEGSANEAYLQRALREMHAAVKEHFQEST